jgi:RimM protein, required for 16S rRNA processing
MNVTLGHISGLFGVRGWVKVHSYCRPPEALLRYRDWTVVPESGVARSMVLVEGRVQGRGLVASLAEIDPDATRYEDRDAAAALVGARIEVPRELLPRLPNGQYYWSDWSVWRSSRRRANRWARSAR